MTIQTLMQCTHSCGAVGQSHRNRRYLSACSGFKPCLQSYEPPNTHSTPPAMPWGSAPLLLWFANTHTATSCSAHFKLTNGGPVNCTPGLHPPQNNQTNFDHPSTHIHTHTCRHPSIHKLRCHWPMPIFIFFLFISPSPIVANFQFLEMFLISKCTEVGHPLRTPVLRLSIFLSKHRCCPSVCPPAWWPCSRVAACWSGPLICVGVVREPYLSTPAKLSSTHCHSHPHHPSIFQLNRGLHRRPLLIF